MSSALRITPLWPPWPVSTCFDASFVQPMPQLELLVGGEACGAILATGGIAVDMFHHVGVSPVRRSYRCAHRDALVARLWP